MDYAEILVMRHTRDLYITHSRSYGVLKEDNSIITPTNPLAKIPGVILR